MTAQEATDLQTESPLFVCTSCGEAVIVYRGQYFRTCEHQGSPFEITLHGLSEVSNGLS